MIPCRFVGRAALLAVGIALTTGAVAQQSLSEARSQRAKAPSKVVAPAPKPELEAKAIDLLKATTDRLAKARSMSFTAIVTYESPSRIGPALAYTTMSDVVMQRPDKLRVITLGDGPASEFYYDGKTMTAFAPAENLVAVSAAPPTIDATLKAAFDSAAIYFPFSDVVLTDPYRALAEGLTVAFYVGQSKVIGGTTTDMVALVNDNVFVQIWIGAEDKLPRMLRAVFRRDPLRLRHQMELSNWKLDLVVAADTFTSTKFAGAVPIAFAHPGGSAASGFRPPAKAKPAGKPAAKPQSTKTP